MSNPWLKKNPFLSLWMSTAHRMAGSIRGRAAAQVRRQVKPAATAATNEDIEPSPAAVTRPAAKRTRKR